MNLDLTQWGLPPLIVAWFRKKNVTSLFPWQLDCLKKRDVLDGGNLVYSAPTSAGKSLVAEILLIKKVLEYGKKGLFIEPFVATAKEKALYLKSMFGTTKARVGAFAGTSYTPGGIAAVSVAVCTIEKANNIVNKLIAENSLKELGIIIVDEIHHVGDDRRGYLIELILTKILYYNSKQDPGNKIQIVGLSATVPNLETLAVWLNASLYMTEYRPIPLVEKIKLGNRIYNIPDYVRNPNCEPIEIVDPSKYLIKKDIDDVFYLCLDSISNGHSILVFCESKRECENLATGLADQIRISGCQMNNNNQMYVELSKKLRESLSVNKIKDVLAKLNKSPAGPDKELMKSLAFGSAFHHAGLTTEEREIIEDGFKIGAIRALMATSTLSSGVNLPARRVVIRSPMMISSNSSCFSREMLNPITYKQMIGRAGRKNIDTSGESVLICNSENQAIAMKLIRSTLGDITSALGHRMLASIKDGGEPGGLKRAILEVIANCTAETRTHINQYLKSSLWLLCASPNEEREFMNLVTDTIRYLINNKFIEELKPDVYKSTRLGNAVLSAGLNPDDSLDLVKDLIKAQGGFLLNSDLHIIYQITPQDIARSIELNDWLHYSNVWNSLNQNYQVVGTRVGIDETVIFKKCQGYLRSMSEEKERVYKRFWVALAINDLICEVPLPLICERYRMSKALVQQVQRQVAQFAGVISIFCEQLGYDNIAALVTPLESRINFSCQRDLLELIKLNLNRSTARTLFKSGYKTIISIAKADKLDIEFVIRQSKPFRKDISFTENDALPSVWVPELALNLTTLDYASHIVESAKAYFAMEYELEVPATNASQNMITSSSSSSQGLLGQTTNKEVPNFVVYYLDSGDSMKMNDFIKQWQTRSSISIAFKVRTRVRESVGRLSRRQLPSCSGDRYRSRSRSRSRSMSQSSGSQTYDEQDDGYRMRSNDRRHRIKDGIRLRTDIDNTETILTRIYVSFEQDMQVFVIDDKKGMEHLRDNLAEQLMRARRDQKMKLYSKDSVWTYKIMNAALNLDRVLLVHYFEWHGFDVAWWMIQNCPNRGLNNRNSSLSLISKTGWAQQYHHFLYRKTGRNRNQFNFNNADENNNIRFEDIVKSGKTAILEPLMNELINALEARNQIDCYMNAEMPSRLAVADMMLHGIGIDMRIIKDELELYDDLNEQLEQISHKEHTKTNVRLSSVREVARVLYEELDLRHHLLERRTIANISRDPTNSEVLVILAQHHPFPKMVIDYRKVSKAKEALQSVCTHLRYDNDLKMERVFGQCDFWQQTGRLSMFDPDLFLINRNFKVLIPGHQNRQPEIIECRTRRCFIPVKGWVLVSADYSQLELRLLAHFAKEQNLIDILNKPSEEYDVFKLLATQVFKKPLDQVDEQMRQHTKQIAYGIIYGMGNTSLANQLLVDIDEAEQFRRQFFDAFPKLNQFFDQVIAESQQLSYVCSLLGRRRTIEGFNVKSESDQDKPQAEPLETIVDQQVACCTTDHKTKAQARAERVAVNTRIQSSASDILKLAMGAMNSKMVAHFDKSARMVLELHDELMFEVDPSRLDEFISELKLTMENVKSDELRVRLPVNIKRGPNWAQLDKI